MLAEAIAALFTGHYDLLFVPVAVPETLVRALLPAEWGSADDAFLSPAELEQGGAGAIPDAGNGKRWICIEAGKQVDTGVNYVPLGKSTFFEAKVEVPFLRHPLAKFTVPFTFKTVMLFSSRLMSFSSNHLTGLRSHHAVCIRTNDSYEAMDWMEIKPAAASDAVVPEGQRWTEDLARKVLEGWWVGEHTGSSASKVRALRLRAPWILLKLISRHPQPAVHRDHGRARKTAQPAPHPPEPCRLDLPPRRPRQGARGRPPRGRRQRMGHVRRRRVRPERIDKDADGLARFALSFFAL